MKQATWLLLLAALVLGLGVAPGWAAPQSSKASSPHAATGQASGRKTAKATTAKSGKSAQHKSSLAAAAAAGRRDPFKLPEVPTGGRANAENPFENGAGGVLPPGARGLLISQLRLEGVVREQLANKMIAVVTNETKRAYFLTENESVYNGVVSKITPDAVYFKENVLDENGRVSTREVVRRLNPAPGEGR